MIILVDYDNVERIDRERGVANIVARVIAAIDPAAFTDQERVEFRFYGGWYAGTTLTRRAQALSADVQRTFPTTFGVSSGGQQRLLRLTGDLAHGLAADKGRVLLDTFRDEQADLSRIACARPPFA